MSAFLLKDDVVVVVVVDKFLSVVEKYLLTGKLLSTVIVCV